MSVASPPRPASVRNVSSKVVEDRPMRYPDTSSREVMTRRGWWLVLLNFLVPGSAQAVAGNRRLGKIGLGATLGLWIAVILGGLGLLLWRQGTVSIITGAWLPDWLGLLRAGPLTIIQIALLAYAVLWIVLTVDTLRLVDWSRRARSPGSASCSWPSSPGHGHRKRGVRLADRRHDP